MNINKTIVTFVFIINSLLFSSCNSSNEFQNGTYYMDGNHDIYFTVTDLKDEVDPEGKYYKTCKIQFSESYDIDSLKPPYINSWVIRYAWDDEGNPYPTEKAEQIKEERREFFQKSVNLKKQFVDNACTFYIYDVADEEYDSIYALIDGANEDSYLELTLDSDGSVAVPIGTPNGIFIDRITFRR